MSLTQDHNLAFKGMASRVRPEVSLAAYCGSSTSYLTSVNLSFLICKIGVIIIHTSLDRCEINELMNAKHKDEHC